MTISWMNETCALPDNAMRDAALARQAELTKPPGALGQIEQIAIDLAAMQGRVAPRAEHIDIVIFAADHGVVEEGVSAFPQAVTCEMVKNFIRGGAAISVLAKEFGANLSVVNAGVATDQKFEGIVDLPVAAGTQNIAQMAAMTEAQLEAALQLGRDQIDHLAGATIDVVIGGEMGIGNTTSATALATRLTGSTAKTLTGPGTGLDDKGVRHKQSVVERAISRLDANIAPLELLRQVGGFEIAALSGFYIRAAQKGYPILVDGFISSVAALLACRINAAVRPWMLFGHASAEPGHSAVIQALEAKPMLDMGMRLGEGSGAALAISLLRSACALHNKMATFAEASVSEKSDVSEV